MANDDDFELDSPNDTPAIREMRARIKEQNRQNREQQQRLEQLQADAQRASEAERQLAFLKAGVNPDDPAARYFVKGYDGDLTTDAIKAAATEARLLGADQGRQDSERTASDLAAHAAIAEAGRSGTPAAADSDYLAELAGARTAEEAIAIANRHDPRNRLIH